MCYLNRKKYSKYLIIPIITAFLSIAAMIMVAVNYLHLTSKPYIEFLNDLQSKNISKIYLTNTPKIKVYLKNNSVYETDNPRTDNFKENMLKEGIMVYETSASNPEEVIPIVLLISSIAAIAVIGLKAAPISSKSLRSVDHMDTSALEKPAIFFKDVAGNEEAKESVNDIVDFLKNPEKYSAYGARMPKGIILYGEPGTGKTLLAKAVAGEANVPFYAVTGSDFVQVYVGVGASRIRQLFKKARSHGKAVIFIDEIDAIGKKRDSSKAGGSDERDQTLNALLTEMSGFNEKEGIVVMAATNRLDMLDEALLRPGRFDRHIEIMLPDVAAREKILSLHLRNKPADNINVHEWAQKTSYFSGAKIESLVNEAAILACKDNSEKIFDTHIDKAFSIVLAGYEKQNRDHIKERDRKITAYHEVGHALTTLKLLPSEKVSKVTIIPSTKGAGGYTLSIPEDNMYQNKNYLKKKIMMLLGGRAAEEIIFGKDYITTGAHNDLKQCTNIAYNMITQYGMGETLGLLNLEVLSGSGVNNSKVIEECRVLVDSLYEDTKQLLSTEKELLEKITQTLLEKETLYYEDLISML